MKTTTPIRIGVSSCLLGHKVRFDGGHKQDAFLTDLLQNFVTYVPLCPEVEMGMSTPRPAIHLATINGDTRLVDPKSKKDWTDGMVRWAEKRLAQPDMGFLSGYVLKKGSPSCGMERVPLHRTDAPSLNKGVGVFARLMMKKNPLLPVEEEGRLNDPTLRENFIERVFSFHRLTTLFSSPWTAKDLILFHTDEKLLLMAHEPEGYRALGRLTGSIKKIPPQEMADTYPARFMETMAHPATVQRHVNVLQHAAGYLRNVAGDAERREMRLIIEDYQRGCVPLIAPIAVLRTLVRVHGIAYLENQTYLNPHPKELMIRNHV